MLRKRPALLVVGAFVCLAVVLTSCSGPVEINDAELSGDLAEACHAFVAALPETVAGEESREVDGHFGAAYGDPAIVVRCGAELPEQLMTTCMQVDGIDWFLDESGSALTVGRVPAIELVVPADEVGSDAVLADVGPAVLEHTAAEGNGCS